jgi:hypothetical protein
MKKAPSVSVIPVKTGIQDQKKKTGFPASSSGQALLRQERRVSKTLSPSVFFQRAKLIYFFKDNPLKSSIRI